MLAIKAEEESDDEKDRHSQREMDEKRHAKDVQEAENKLFDLQLQEKTCRLFDLQLQEKAIREKQRRYKIEPTGELADTKNINLDQKPIIENRNRQEGEIAGTPYPTDVNFHEKYIPPRSR